MRLCKPHRTIGATCSRQLPNPPTVPVISTAVEKSLFNRPRETAIPPTQQLLKRRNFVQIQRSQRAHFQRLPNSLSVCAFCRNRPLVLSTTYSLFLHALCHFSYLQSFVFNLLWTLLAKIPGGRGYGLSKKRARYKRKFNGRRLAASPRAPWHHSRRSVRQCTPAETRSTAESPSCPSCPARAPGDRQSCNKDKCLLPGGHNRETRSKYSTGAARGDRERSRPA